MLSKNPFRNPALPVHESEMILPPPSPPLPPLPQRTPSPRLPALPPRSPSSGPSEPRTSASHDILLGSSAPPGSQDIDDDLPPPYTPAANIGEETVDLGPRRPFQQPPPLPSSLHPPADRYPYQNWPPPPRPPWEAPGSYAQQDSGGLAPWQTQQQYRQRQKVGGGLINALIDTVRDIADVVSGAHDERVMATQSTNAAAYGAPYTSTRTVYAPPAGPPQQVVYQPPPDPPPRPASAPPHSPPPIPDDGSPTRTPAPGHPLLLNGNLLVYPRDHLCVKCKNTGYKNYDPSNPCRKCWNKYGRTYAGALTYTPWSPSGNDPRMQRPLPKFVPPHLAGSSTGSSWPPRGLYLPPPQHPQHSRSISQPRMHSPGSGPSYHVIDPLSPCDPPPVPHAIYVGPGDPRIGGRLCMRCGGAGIRTVMLIDTITCDRCGGSGRVWR